MADTRVVDATNQSLAILKSMVILRLGEDSAHTLKNPGNSEASCGQIIE